VDAAREQLSASPAATCAQCGGRSDINWKGWRAYRADDPETSEPPALALFCPTCSAREFGDI